jgi:predicted ATPase
LPPKQGQSLLRHWFPAVSRPAADFVLERWEGNPQFLEEMAASLDRGTIAVPEVVHAIVEGRLEGIEPDVRRVLRAASLFGEKMFDADALIALLGETARKGIAEWLEVLVMRDFIERQVAAGSASYRFRERLVRDAAYHMLTSADRVLGRRLARAWLEGAGRTLPEFLADPSDQTSRRSVAGG